MTQHVYENLGPCILHTGYISPFGYGHVTRERKRWQAHRWAAYVAFGPAPPGKPVVRHKCDNRACINPDHLEYGTQSENLIDRRERHRYKKLTRADADSIKALLAGGATSQRAIARTYGISRRMVSFIQQGKQWN